MEESGNPPTYLERRGSAVSRTSSMLRGSTHSDISTMYANEGSTLSRAMLHNSSLGDHSFLNDDDEEVDRYQANRRSGWHGDCHHSRQAPSGSALEGEGGDNSQEPKGDTLHEAPWRRGSAARSESSNISDDDTRDGSVSAAEHDRSFSGTEMDGSETRSSSIYEHNDLSLPFVGRSAFSSLNSDRGRSWDGDQERRDEAAAYRFPARLPRTPVLTPTALLSSGRMSTTSVASLSSARVRALSVTSGDSYRPPSHSRRSTRPSSFAEAADVAAERRRASSSSFLGDDVSQGKMPSFSSSRGLSGRDRSRDDDARAGERDHTKEAAHDEQDKSDDASAEAVWPYTEQLEVRIIMAEIRKRIEWNRSIRQLLLLVPLIFLYGFYSAYNTSVTQGGLLVANTLEGMLTRTPFPSAATSMERYRQQVVLGLPISVPTDRFFEDVRTQTDWIDYFADTVMPAFFPALAETDNVTLDVPEECRPQGHNDSSSSDDRCFSSGHLWWEIPGCFVPSEDDDANVDGLFDDAIPSDAVVTAAAKHRQQKQRAGAADDDADAVDDAIESVAETSGGHRGANALADGSSSSSSGSASSSAPQSPCSASKLFYRHNVLLGPAQNVFLGSLRVRTIRMRAHSAKLQRRLYPSNASLFPMDAWSRGHSESAEETTPVRCPSIRLHNPLSGKSAPLYVYRSRSADSPYCVEHRSESDRYHCGGYTFEVPFHSTPWLAAQYRDAVRNPACFFVDNWATRFIVMEFFTYTPDSDVFQMVKLRTEVLASGLYQNKADFRTFQVWTPNRTGELVYISVTLVYTVLYLLSVLIRLRWQLRVGGWADVLGDLSAWVDFFMIAGIVTSAAYYYVWTSVSTSVLPRLALPMQSRNYPAFLDVVHHRYDQFVMSTGITVLLCFARLFCFRVLFGPFTTFITALEMSLPTILTTALIFMTLNVGYAVAAYVVFGTSVALYSSYSSALYTVLGHWYATLFVIPSDEVVARQFASLFFWSLTIMLIASFIGIYVAAVTLSFSRLQAIFGVTYDEQWVLRELKKLGRSLTWPRVKWFLGKLFFVYPEDDCLLQMLESMNLAFYGSNGVDADGRSASPFSDTASRVVAAATPRGTSDDTPSMNAAVSDGTKPAGGAGEGAAAVAQDQTTPVSQAGVPPLSATEVCNPLARSPHAARTAAASSTTTAATAAAASSFASTARHRRLSCNSPVRRAAEELRELQEELPEVAMAYRPISLRDWCGVIPADVAVQCGGMPYFKAWWRAMAEAQAEVSSAPEEQKRRGLRGKVAIATERGVVNGIAGIGHLEHTLTLLEAHVDSLLKNATKR